MIKLKPLYRSLQAAAALLIVLIPLSLKGQNNHNYWTVSITGQTSVCPDGITQYTYTTTESLNWSITGGSFVGANSGTSVTVVWTAYFGDLSASAVVPNCWIDPEIYPPVVYCDYDHFDTSPFSVLGCAEFQTVGGGGELCTVDPVDLVVTLSSSTLSCSYQLYRTTTSAPITTTAVGPAVSGNGLPLVWTGINTAGTYTIVPSCPPGLCSPVVGSATVTQFAGSVGGTATSNPTSSYGWYTGISLSLSGYTGGVERWEYSNGENWMPIANASSDFVYTPTITQTTSFRAVTRNGNYGCMVAYSSPVTVSILPFKPQISAVTGITAVSFIANWNPVSGATGYLLDVSANSSFSPMISGYSNLACSSTSQNVTGLSPSSTYFYRVWAVNGSGNSQVSNYSQVTTASLSPPTTLAASNIKSDQFTANWTNVASATSYQLDVATDPGFTSIVSGYNSKSVTGTSDIVSGLIAKAYYYRVRAVAGGSPSANSAILFAANLDRNYVKSTTLQIAVTDSTQIKNLSIQSRLVSYSYVDGLGRPTQQISYKLSPAQNDIVQAVGYDEFGRAAIKYLPFVTESNGKHKGNFLPADNAGYASSTNPQYQFYQGTSKIAGSTKPYSFANLESSPHNRLIEQGAPGLDWQPDGTISYSSTDKTVKHDYLFNGANEVLKWTFSPPSTTFPIGMVSAGASTSLQYYAINMLTKHKTKDEQGNEVIEYADKSGRTLLKRVQAGASTTISDTNYASTYYVYDDVGQLVYVIPPEASKLLSNFHDASNTSKNGFMNRWAFRYKYDERRRMVLKQVPGADSVRMVYDNLDRLVMTQDGNQRLSNKWSYTKYDQLNRPIITGIYTHGSATDQKGMRLQLSTSLFHEKYDGTSSTEGYTSTVFPTSNVLPLTVTYYDNYAFTSMWTGSWTYQLDANFKDTTNAVVTAQSLATAWAFGQVTGAKVKVLDGGATATYTWLKSINYYDVRKNLVQSISDNYKGSTDVTTNIVDFAGKVLKSRTVHDEKDVTWKDLVGTTVVGNKLDRTQSGTGWNAGAVSANVLAANQSGWVEFTVGEIISNRTIGLANSNPDGGISSMNYALNLNGSALTAYESNSPTSIAGAIVVGDVLRIERSGTTVTYKKNGTVVRTAPGSSTSLLMVDVSINGNAKTITDVRASFASSTRTVNRKFEYDHAARVTKVRHQLDATPKVYLLSNEYNEIGQLVDKKLHSSDNGTTWKQSVDHRYNIRGWLETVNNSKLEVNSATNDDANDLFGFELKYNVQDADLSNAQFYNGNISGVKWSNYPGNGFTTEKGYVYNYDQMNRIRTSAYRQKTMGSWSTLSNNRFAETGYEYDLNGNLMALARNDARASGTMDNLTYNYGGGGGNRLKKVTDSGDPNLGFLDGANSANEYTYDSAGNMTGDLNKNLTITYNHMNLPEVVRRGNDTVRYVYDASGRKLWQGVIFDRGVKATDYAGEFIYENDALQFANHEEGRITIATNTQLYRNPGEAVTEFTAVNATLSALTQNGTESYIRVTSSGTTSRTGVYPIGGTYTVAEGEKYLIRVKGYRTGSNAAYIQVKTTSGTDIAWPGASISANAASEAWTELLVVIPSGVTSMKVGVNWNTVVTNEVMYINEVEVNKLSSGTREYQYHLKDHLGNVRMTFTSSPPLPTNVTAGFETANQATEGSNLLHYPAGGQINTQSTNAHTGNNSQLLNGGYSGQVGVAKTFSVMPGDQVQVQAYAKYGTPSGTPANYTGFVAALLSAFNLPAPAPSETGTAASAVNSFANWEIGGSGNISQADARKVFVTIIMFDRNYNFLDVTYQASSSSNSLLSASYTAKEPGYAYVYVSNEHNYLLDVYFDDVTVLMTPSPVIATDDYYAFGLSMSSSLRESTLNQKSKYNGKEQYSDLDIGWLDFGARMYMPAIGRWGGIDKSSEKYFGQSPFHYAGNNPTLFVDYDGNDYGVSVNHDAKTITISAKYISTQANYDAVSKAITTIKEQSGEFKYVVGKGKDAQVYSIVFDLTQDTAEGPEGDQSSPTYKSRGDELVINDKTGELNSFDSVPNGFFEGNSKGSTDSDKITIEENKKGTGTATHEILHTLGVSHDNMSSANGGGKATKSMVAEMLAGVGIGGTNNGLRNLSGGKLYQGVGDGSRRPDTGKGPYYTEGFEKKGGVMSKRRIDKILSKVLKKTEKE